MTYKCWPCPNIQCSQQWAASRQGRSVPTSGCFARLPRARAVFLAIVDGPNSPSCSALAWYSCWPGLSPWGESWKRTRVARTAALTRYRYATQPTSWNECHQGFGWCCKGEWEWSRTSVGISIVRKLGVYIGSFKGVHRAAREFNGGRKVGSLVGLGEFILVFDVANLIGYKESGCGSKKKTKNF